jgi:hypothetical protein
MYAHCFDFGRSFLWVFWPCSNVQTGMLNSLRWPTFGFKLCHTLYRVLSVVLVYEQFWIYATCCTTGSQRNSSNFSLMSIALASSTRVWFMHSATPFWEGEYSAVIWTLMPLSVHHNLKSVLVNSVLQSIQMACSALFLTVIYARYSFICYAAQGGVRLAIHDQGLVS